MLVEAEGGKFVVPAPRGLNAERLCVPKTSSTSGDQVIFVDQATSASLFSNTVLAEVDWLG